MSEEENKQVQPSENRGNPQQEERAGKAANSEIPPRANFASSEPTGGTAPPDTPPPPPPPPSGNNAETGADNAS